MMGIIGFLFLVVILAAISANILAAGLFGGYEFSLLPIKHYWWYAPLLLIIGYLWYILFTYSPITIQVV